jgi:hypothetical protein
MCNEKKTLKEIGYSEKGFLCTRPSKAFEELCYRERGRKQKLMGKQYFFRFIISAEGTIKHT